FDAFKEGAGLIEASAAVDEGGIEVDVGFDERGGDEQALGVDDLRVAACWDLAGDALDLPVVDQDVGGDGSGLVLEQERAALDQDWGSFHLCLGANGGGHTTAPGPHPNPLPEGVE